jgi:hypothetical protein
MPEYALVFQAIGRQGNHRGMADRLQRSATTPITEGPQPDSVSEVQGTKNSCLDST